MAAAVVGLVAGCGESPPERAGTVNESSAASQESDSQEAETEDVKLDAVGRRLTTAEAESALPQVSSLPTGWSVDPENSLNDDSDDDSKATIEPEKCQDIIGDVDDKNDEPTGEASRTYSAGMLGPFMSVEISSFAKEVPDDSFSKVLDALSKCPEYTSTEDGEATTFKTSSLSFPNLDEETAAFRMSATTAEMPVGVDMVAVRAGHNVLTISYTTIGAGGGSGDALEKLARATVANLEKG
ncbi:hypothetical protein ACTHQ1_03625 [Janibacter anophelis]